jgi:hypothetical protein
MYFQLLTEVVLPLCGVFVLVLTTCAYLRVYHPLPIVLSYDEVLFYGFSWIEDAVYDCVFNTP